MAIKKTTSTIFLLLIVLNCIAQFEYDYNGKIVPFSLSKKYSHLIDMNKINTYQLPSYDNDSLYWYANFERTYIKKEPGNIVSKETDTLLDLKNVGSKYKLKHGNVWIYKITSETAEGVIISLKKFKIPEGALWAVYGEYRDGKIDLPTIDNSESFNRNNLRFNKIMDMKKGRELIIEYYEPNEPEFKAEIIIEEIAYVYDGLKKKDLKTLPNRLKKSFQISTLKNGQNANFNCQEDLACYSEVDLSDESKSICYIVYFYHNSEGVRIRQRFTGTFINKGGNYKNTDLPLILTCGHTFNAHDFSGQIDFSNGFPGLTFIYINKKNIFCNDPTEDAIGTILPNSRDFKVLKLGKSYNKHNWEFDWQAHEDYAILQAPETVDFYSVYGIQYTGWDRNIANTGNHRSIAHPEGSPQKIFVDYDWPTYPTGGKCFNLFFDKGVTDKACSGAAILNNKLEVVGWVSASNEDADCAYVGTEDDRNLTQCGSLGEAYLDIITTIDPLGYGFASSYIPTVKEVPVHCKNCVQDYDKGETGIDCGGPCLPCGLSDRKKIQFQDGIENELKARHELEISPITGTTINLKQGNYEFKAGAEIIFNNGFTLDYGVDFLAEINENLRYEGERGCQKPCLYLPTAFSPNGDGVNDVWGIKQSFIESYSIEIEANDITWLFIKNAKISENGLVSIWNGKKNNTGVMAIPGVYTCTIVYTDCYGITRNTIHYLHVFSPVKNVENENRTELVFNDNFELINELKVYPNPTSEKITIDYLNHEGEYEYSIIDQSGKTLIHDCSNEKTDLDLSNYKAGLYILRVKVGDEYQTRKIIKK